MRKRHIAMIAGGAAAVLLIGGVSAFAVWSWRDIGEEQIKKIAYKDAGISESDVERVHILKDRDDGRFVYEIGFVEGAYQHEYEIAASNGKILNKEVEPVQFSQNLGRGNAVGGQQNTQTQTTPNAQQTQAGTNAGAQQTQAGTNAGAQQTQAGTNAGVQQAQAGTNTGVRQAQANTNPQPSVQVSIETATQMVLDKVPGATSERVWINLDFDDGIYKYEGELFHNGFEYDFEIDANTGTFLEWKEERQDGIWD